MRKRRGCRANTRLATVLGGMGVAAVVLAGCGSNGTAVAQHGSIPATPTAAGPSSTPVPPPNISVVPKDGATGVALDQPVQVSIDTGQLDSVVVHTDSDSTPIAGRLGLHNRSWQSAAPLDPRVHYVVQATAHDSGGTSAAKATFTTLAVDGRLQTTYYPDDGTTVGIGMPIILRFNEPVASDKQANLVSHVQVQTSVPVAGDWHWFSESEVHWRPKDYWPSGTHVTVSANLRGISVGNNIWGLGDWTSSFTIGDKHYSEIDAAAHQMKVYSNDQLLYTYPVSTGVDNKWPTLSGTLFVWYKVQKVRMTSEGIGIPKNAPGGYDEDVFWDTAISTDGFFIHAAPWSVWAQGSQNVSHGCVNLSEARAVQFYNFSQQGDVVVVKGTTRVADGSDGEADWQVPWAQFANSGGQIPAPTAAAPASSGGI